MRTRHGKPHPYRRANPRVVPAMTRADQTAASLAARDLVAPDEMNPVPVTIIQPQRGWASLDLQALWRYRELLFFLAWRDVKVRYKQTVIGAAWAIIQPLLTMVVFTIFLGGLAKVPSDGKPYPLFVFCGLLPWQMFASAATESSNSLVGSQSLLTKVYFPRLVIPAAAVLTAVVDFVVAFSVLVVMMFVYGVSPSPAVVAMPLFALLALATALGVGLWLSALNVQYRDIRYAVPFLIQLWFFATPVAYPLSLVPPAWRPITGLNPMTSVTEGFRWALLQGTPPPGTAVLVSVMVAAGLLITGLAYFRRMESRFADLV